MTSLIITDDNNYKNNDSKILFLDKYIRKKKNYSILSFIEQNSDFVKLKLKKKLNNLSKNLSRDKNFTFKNNFNFLNYFFLYDRSIYKYTSINEYIKIIAIENFLKKKKIKNVILIIKNRSLLQCIHKILKLNKIKVQKNSNIIKYKNKIYNFLISFVRIFNFISKRIFLKSPAPKNFNNKNIIVSYLAYLDKKCLKRNKLKTTYWSDFFYKNNNIFFFYIFNENANDSITKVCKIQNLSSANFIIIDSILSIKDFIFIIIGWVKLSLFFYLKKEKFISNFNKMDSSYELFKEDIYNSLFGFDSFINYYYYYLFKKISKMNFYSKNIFYVSENQGWEKSLNYHLRNKTNKRFAVISTLVRYWDLRYLDHNNFYHQSDKCKYLPDNYIVNGNISEINLLRNKFLKDKIIKAEAVRYNTSRSNFFKNIKTNNKNKNFLIAGDYNKTTNKKLEKLVIFLANKFKSNLFYIKQHPNLKFGSKLSKIKNCIFKDHLSIKDLSKIAGRAIIPNMTSASVDAVLNGLDTVVLLSDKIINFSPLKGEKYILHENDFESIKRYFEKINKKIKIKNNFFNLNKKNKVWKKII